MLVLRRLTLVALLLMLALGACRPGSSSDGPTGRQEPAQEVALQAAGGRRLGGSVTLLGAWEGVELDAFLDMVAPFQKATGVSVFFRSSRDVSGVISRSLNSGDPPDLAGLPGPGLMTNLIWCAAAGWSTLVLCWIWSSCARSMTRSGSGWESSMAS